MGTSVLVVDDDYDIRTALQCALEFEGYAVYQAPDGEPALERLREHPEGMVVLLDVNLPGMDGIQVMQAIQAQETLATRHAYIIMTALYDSLPPAFERQLAHLDIPIIAKPFDLQTVLDAVSTAALDLSGVPT